MNNQTLLKMNVHEFERQSLLAGESYLKVVSNACELSDDPEEEIRLDIGELTSFISCAFGAGARWVRNELLE